MIWAGLATIGAANNDGCAGSEPLRFPSCVTLPDLSARKFGATLVVDRPVEAVVMPEVVVISACRGNEGRAGVGKSSPGETAWAGKAMIGAASDAAGEARLPTFALSWGATVDGFGEGSSGFGGGTENTDCSKPASS